MGFTPPFMRQLLQGEQAVTRLPPDLVTFSLGAWSEALVLTGSNPVAAIWLHVNVSIEDRDLPLSLSWGCLAHAQLGHVFRVIVCDTRGSTRLD